MAAAAIVVDATLQRIPIMTLERIGFGKTHLYLRYQKHITTIFDFDYNKKKNMKPSKCHSVVVVVVGYGRVVCRFGVVCTFFDDPIRQLQAS